MQEVSPYKLPVAEDGDTADMPEYSGKLVTSLVAALNTRAPMVSEFGSQAIYQSPDPETPTQSTKNPIRLSWFPSRAAAYTLTVTKLSSPGFPAGGSFQLMRNDGKNVNLSTVTGGGPYRTVVYNVASQDLEIANATVAGRAADADDVDALTGRVEVLEQMVADLVARVELLEAKP